MGSAWHEVSALGRPATRWGSLLAMLLVAACGGDRDAAPAGDGGSVATVDTAATAPAAPTADKATPPATSDTAASGGDTAGRAQTGTHPAAAGRTRYFPDHHADRRGAAARRVPSGAEGHRRSGDLRRVEAVQPELRPLSRRGRAGDDHRAPSHHVPEAGWSDQHSGVVRPDGLRGAPVEGHAVVVRARHGSGEDQPDLLVREGQERGEDCPGAAGSAPGRLT